MAYSAADLIELEQALSSGVLTAEYDGQRVTFQSVDQLRKAIRDVKAGLANQAGGSPSTMATFAEMTRD